MERVLWWARRDLRLADNRALNAALNQAEQVVPVFVLDPMLLERYEASTKRLAFLFGGLRALDRDLRARGSRLVIRRGRPADELAALVDETGAGAVFAEEDFSPYARERDERVAKRMSLRLEGSHLVHPPGSVLKSDGDPYVAFTWFARTWKSLPVPGPGDLLPSPERLPTLGDVASLSIPDQPGLPDQVPFPPGETEAQARLAAFARGEQAPIERYAERRDRMDLDGTSRLSPYLRFGMLSARQAIVAARERSGEGAAAWLDELIWREFYSHILYHFPKVLDRSFRAAYRDLAWEDDQSAFEAWCEGRTGYPVIDAAMRQLVQSGWMHNRARMAVAAFLTKDLLIDWRWGERFFMVHLIDGDPAANNGGWQWAAGTGTDAAPYFRIFNPVLQGETHDPQGAYVRRWVPELAQVPDQFVHSPWEMAAERQRELGCIIGEDYPRPIIEHSRARKRALERYKEAKHGSS